MDRTFVIDAPSVASEVIDGEAVIMHLKLGHYYSTDGSGGMIWAGIEQAWPRDRILAALLERYEGEAAEIAASLDEFLGSLLAQGLVREARDGNGQGATPGALPPATAKAPFVAPVLNTYSDMKDLLLLDPIHDVDEVGWPTAAKTEDGAG